MGGLGPGRGVVVRARASCASYLERALSDEECEVVMFWARQLLLLDLRELRKLGRHLQEKRAGMPGRGGSVGLSCCSLARA